MAAPISNDTPGYDFMYPDLLSKDGLVFILRQRYISHLYQDLDSLDKEALIGLYNRYILPLPQRTYRPNKRGQQMTRAQKLIDRKRKIPSTGTEGSNSAAKKSRVEAVSSGLINYHSSPSPSGDRLKPPPSCINFQNKVVKLKPDSNTLAAKKSDDATVLKASKTEAELQKTKPNANSSELSVKKNSGTVTQKQLDEEMPIRQYKAKLSNRNTTKCQSLTKLQSTRDISRKAFHQKRRSLPPSAGLDLQSLLFIFISHP